MPMRVKTAASPTCCNRRILPVVMCVPPLIVLVRISVHVRVAESMKGQSQGITSFLRIITAQETVTVSRRNRVGLPARYPPSAELASDGLGEEYARGRAESHKKDTRKPKDF